MNLLECENFGAPIFRTIDSSSDVGPGRMERNCKIDRK